MRILFVTPRLPYPPDRGDRLKIYNLLKQIGEDHEVHLVSLYQDVAEVAHQRELTNICASVTLIRHRRFEQLAGAALAAATGHPAQIGYFFSRGLIAHLRRLGKTATFDSVHLHLLRMAPYRRLLPWPILLDLTDCPSLYLQRRAEKAPSRLRRLAWSAEARLMARYERRVASFPAVSVCSEADRTALLASAPDANVGIYPNGLDFGFWVRRSPWPTQSRRIVFTGNMGYAPNADAAQYLCDEIYPLIQRQAPDVTLTVAGQSPGPEVLRLGERSGVTVTGYVEDLRDCYESAEVAIAPVRFGAGTLNKILEPMALRVPVVASAESVSGMTSVEPGVHMLVGHSAQELADAVLAILGDEALARRLAEHAEALVRDENDWRAIARRLAETHREIAGQSVATEPLIFESVDAR